MKKTILMLGCSVLVLSSSYSYALTSNEQLQAMKEIISDTFKEIDTDRDDCITKEEYLNYQFEKFRASILSASNFDTKLDETVFVSSNKDSKEQTGTDKKESTIKDGINIMQSMVDFKLDEEELELPNLDEEDIDLPNLDESVSKTEDEITSSLDIDDMPSLEALSKESLASPLLEETLEPKEDTNTTKENDNPKDMNFVVDMLKSSLPKKIDDITTWIDVKYDNNTISYIYQADMDTSTFSKDELLLLTNSIKLESCTNAYKQMCPKIKPIFIDEGINMQISYIDKNKTELSSCEFNQETCK